MTTSKVTLDSIDRILVKGLKSGDAQVRQTCVMRLFYKDCRNLINTIRYDLFKGNVEYDDIVNELYLHISADNWRVLDSYRGEAKLVTWLSCVAWRYFIRVHKQNEKEPVADNNIYRMHRTENTILDTEIRMDVEAVLDVMPNRRYAEVISKHIVEGMGVEEVASLLRITVPNFYNLKSRAIRQFLTIYKYVKMYRIDNSISF